MVTIDSIALNAATDIMALPAADDLLGGAGQLKAQIQIIVRNYVEDALHKAQLAEKEQFESLHQHISHLRAMIYPQKMSESAAWRAVPVKHLSAIQSLIDPPPVVVGDKTMVFVNPHAAEALTAISAKVRAMLAEPLPEQPAAAPSGDDGERYRWLIKQIPCNIADALSCSINEIGEEIDSARKGVKQ